MTAMDLALAAEIVSHGGIVIDRDAIDRCSRCRTTYRRRNAFRHYASRKHARAFSRWWRSRYG